jgi:lysophospholipase L1-like esterase
MKLVASIVLVGTIVLGAVGCSSDDPTTSAPTSDTTTTSTSEATTPSTTPIASTLAKGDKYVALGSSIASGFGISVQSTDCGRSNRNYPMLIAAEYDLALTDVTCGAATIPNIVDTAQGAHPPQITAVTEDTKLITVTVGGNDIGYNGTAVACGSPQTVCSAPASLESDLATARVALKDMVEQLETTAPSATIVFVTYPREIPEGNCPDLSYTDEEAAVVRNMGTKLEDVFVDAIRNTGVVFVDPYVEAGDHTGCAPESERWTAGYHAADGFAYHPTALGHEVMARMISKALKG